MKECSLFNKINSEKGASTIMVLCVILMLTVLGTVALAASAVNVRLSGKVMNWTKEYYTLDTQAEEYVQMIDQQLTAAENDARTYVQARYDKKLPGELPPVFTNVTYNMAGGSTEAAQAFFNDHFKTLWTTSNGAIEITLQDYLEDPELVKDRSVSYIKGTTTTEQAFSADVEKYTEDLYYRVYFFMLSRRLEALSESVTLGAIAIDGGEAPLTEHCTDKFTDFGLTAWDSMAPNDGDVKLTINVSNNNAADPKEVHAQISIVKPVYDTILQTISTPVYGNPVWTNAITAGGSITVTSGASITVGGDVYASGTDGISINGSGNNIIRGNIYTQGDLAVTGNNGSLRVYSSETGSSGVSYDKKRMIFGNEYFFDTSMLITSSGAISADSFSTGSRSGMPFFFRDYFDRGNVYCSSLLVKEGVDNARLQVDGNIWTKDDIQMDGRRSSISIGNAAASGSTNYIGLNPYSSDTDPNSSSSVINNFPFNDDGTPDSSITINSNFVVPGVAFYEFSGGPAGYQVSPGGKYYYKSAESVSARTTSPTAIIYGYYYNVASGSAHGTFTSDEDVDFDLITPADDINTKKNALYNFSGLNGGIRTNITTDLTEPDGYTAGVAFLQPAAGSDAVLYTADNPSGIPVTGTASAISMLPDSGKYLVDYSLLQSALMKAFDSKTKQFGRPARCSIDDLVDTSIDASLPEIVKISLTAGQGTLDLDPASGIHEGIVYCGGNLTIRGNGVFRGTIICSGNVTIEGSPTIIYDENVICDKLKAYKNVRDFFSKGNTGSVIDTINEYSSTSGVRTVLKRYRIRSWQEKAPAPGP